MSKAAVLAKLPRDILIVAVFNTLIAAGLTLANRSDFFTTLIYSQCIGLSVLLSIDVGRKLIWGTVLPHWLPMLVLSALGIAFGFAGGAALAAAITGRPLGESHLAVTMVVTLCAGTVATWYFFSRERVAQLRLAAEQLERSEAQARLKLLQAQIEPHFLFNTLANLQLLIGADPQRAQEMLVHLNSYLRSALDAARSETSSLAEEFGLLRGYCEVLAIRMGPRFTFSLSLPPALAAHPLPPVLLLPLVENAVKHGIEPKVEGGRIDIVANVEAASLVLAVTDTGLGLGNSPVRGTGVGLSLVRGRLAAAYGEGASLKLLRNPSGGVIARLCVPLHSTVSL